MKTVDVAQRTERIADALTLGLMVSQPIVHAVLVVAVYDDE